MNTKRPSLTHLALIVADVDASLADERTGYSGMLSDPDGHNVELSYGQDVGVHAERARSELQVRDGSSS